MIPMLWYVAKCGHIRPNIYTQPVEASDVGWFNTISNSCLQTTCPHFSKALAADLVDHVQAKAR